MTPLLNGSVLEAGKVKLMSEGESMDGEKEMEPHARCADGSKAKYFPFLTVNLPERKNPANASLMAASILAC